MNFVSDSSIDPLLLAGETSPALPLVSVLIPARNEVENIPPLLAKVAADPADHESRFELAQAQFAAGAREDAVDSLLEIVRRDRTWNEEAARKELVKYFEAFGPTDPLTLSARRRLSSILFS